MLNRSYRGVCVLYSVLCVCGGGMVAREYVNNVCVVVVMVGRYQKISEGLLSRVRSGGV